jgi:protoheme IX farnesyltransferase
MVARLKTLFQLSKLPVSLLAACSTATGFLLASERFSLRFLFPSLGIFLLACGASALNQVQERDTDALMERTKTRPLPTGRISRGGALFFSLGMLASGALALFFFANLLTLGLGLLAALWYNGVYTYLKRKTPFAVIPGALVGAIPPAAGWAAGGGRLGDPQMAALALFFFIWQVPHFGLLLFKRGKEYERAGLPSLTSFFEQGQLLRIFFIWMLAASVTCLAVPFYGAAISLLSRLSLLAASLWLAWNAVRLLREGILQLDYAFRGFNLFALGVMLLLSLGKFLNGIGG